MAKEVYFITKKYICPHEETITKRLAPARQIIIPTTSARFQKKAVFFALSDGLPVAIAIVD
ncbi:MAG: hypothetical protein HC817_15480 [Saprospiraceae bacterium]|nr:hypothetical protein [Saprospiraceae bacterium]